MRLPTVIHQVNHQLLGGCRHIESDLLTRLLRGLGLLAFEPPAYDLAPQIVKMPKGFDLNKQSTSLELSVLDDRLW